MPSTDTARPNPVALSPIDEPPPKLRPNSPPLIKPLPLNDPKPLSPLSPSPTTPKPLNTLTKPRSPTPDTVEPPNDGDIDMDIFQQILELDDDGGDEFSREMVWAYFTQAESTFGSMDKALAKKDLADLSSLGHFLKGSSAALGVRKVQVSCEKIQHYGQRRDEEKNVNLTEKEALGRIEALLTQVKEEYEAAKGWLEEQYPPKTE